MSISILISAKEVKGKWFISFLLYVIILNDMIKSLRELDRKAIEPGYSLTLDTKKCGIGVRMEKLWGNIKANAPGLKDMLHSI